MRGVLMFFLMPVALAADAARVFPPPLAQGHTSYGEARRSATREGGRSASQPGLKTRPTYQAPLAGLFNEQQGPIANYRGYAFADCAATAPAVRVVALQGIVPDGVPRTAPRPSIEILINAALDKAVGQQFTVDPKAGPGGAVVASCPVVGDCAAAGNGTVSLTSKADDGTLVGEFLAKWAIGAPRAGRFTVAWRQSENKCG